MVLIFINFELEYFVLTAYKRKLKKKTPLIQAMMTSTQVFSNLK
jgi:hypothetical protein